MGPGCGLPWDPLLYRGGGIAWYRAGPLLDVLPRFSADPIWPIGGSIDPEIVSAICLSVIQAILVEAA